MITPPSFTCPPLGVYRGFQLPARQVIHTVGPIYEGPQVSAPLLRNAYVNSLKLANEQGLKTVAFPAISCGVYGYPLTEAAEVALRAVADSLGGLAEVHFVLFGQPTFDAFDGRAEQLFGKQLPSE